MDKNLVFVYGTLKQNQPHHNEYMRGQAYLGRYRTRNKFPLVVVNQWYSPVMFPEPGVGKHVIGELYQVDKSTLSILDKLESVNKKTGYRRELIEIQNIVNKKIVSAYVYTRERQYASVMHSDYLSEYLDTRYVLPNKRRKQSR